MPLYDFECPRGHRFEHQVTIADREKAVPCTTKIEVADFDAPQFIEDGTPPPVTEKPCMLPAKKVITHSHPETLLDYGLGANRDAARAGTYNPANPIRRGVRH